MDLQYDSITKRRTERASERCMHFNKRVHVRRFLQQPQSQSNIELATEAARWRGGEAAQSPAADSRNLGSLSAAELRPCTHKAIRLFEIEKQSQAGARACAAHFHFGGGGGGDESI